MDKKQVAITPFTGSVRAWGRERRVYVVMPLLL